MFSVSISITSFSMFRFLIAWESIVFPTRWLLDWVLYVRIKLKRSDHQFLFYLVFLSRNGCHILPKVFSVFREMIIRLFSLDLLILGIIIIDFLTMSHPCIPVTTPHHVLLKCAAGFSLLIFYYFCFHIHLPASIFFPVHVPATVVLCYIIIKV